MTTFNRRRFLSEIGAGMLLAGLGPGLVRDLDLVPLGLQDADDRIDLGAIESLVRMMQETPADRISAACVEKLRGGTTIAMLVAAAALANARTFGGEDYTGYHCEMALMPACQMAAQMPEQRLAALPVLKVVYRNATRIQECGGRTREVLRRVAPAAGADAAALLAAERAGDAGAAEAGFASIFARQPELAYDALQDLVRENIDVHQVVLAWRAWDLLSVVGREHAVTMLRQSVRKCVDAERIRVKNGSPPPAIRELLPRLLEEHHLVGGPAAQSRPVVPDAAVDALAWRIFGGGAEDAARAVAAALGSGLGTAAAGEALSLASVRLLLHDSGHKTESVGKPRGSVHGASIGVHASDSASAWRHIAAVTPPRTAAASLVTAGWHTGGQSGGMDRERPVHAAARARAADVAAKDVPGALEESIRARDQAAAAALVERYGALGLAPAPLVERLLTHAVEYDGALHHEKFFRTAFEEFTAARPAFRWEYLTALARVVASGYGFEAPGLREARERLLA